jgi:post-segregation antitoxin (ccd killing protein)
MQEYFNERLSQETHQLQVNMSKKIQEALNQQNSNSNTTRSSIKERQTVLESLSNNKKLEAALN